MGYSYMDELNRLRFLAGVSLNESESTKVIYTGETIRVVSDDSGRYQILIYNVDTDTDNTIQLDLRGITFDMDIVLNNTALDTISSNVTPICVFQYYEEVVTFLKGSRKAKYIPLVNETNIPDITRFIKANKDVIDIKIKQSVINKTRTQPAE